MTSKAGSAASSAPGAPSDEAVNAMRANAETGAASSTLKYVWNMPINDTRASNDYPMVMSRKDAYDDVANIKAQYAQAAAGTNWIVPFSTKDAEYLQRKRDDEEKAAFDQWVMQKFNTADPAQNMMLQNIAPELYQRREDIINMNQDLVSRYAKLRLRGVKNISDLHLEWLIETGRLALPKGPIWDPLAWRKAQYDNLAGDLAADTRANQHRYVYGLFSPLRWLLWGQRGWAPAAGNPADVYGDPATPYARQAVRPLPIDAAWSNFWGYPSPMPSVGHQLATAGTPADPHANQIAYNNQVADYRAQNWYPAAAGGGGGAPAPAPAPAPGPAPAP